MHSSNLKSDLRPAVIPLFATLVFGAPVLAAPLVPVESLPDLPRPASNNAVTMLADPDRVLLISAPGPGSGKTCRDALDNAWPLQLGGAANPHNDDGAGYDGRPAGPEDLLLGFDPAEPDRQCHGRLSVAATDHRGLPWTARATEREAGGHCCCTECRIEGTAQDPAATMRSLGAPGAFHAGCIHSCHVAGAGPASGVRLGPGGLIVGCAPQPEVPG